jgi:hypothetical protein
VGSNGTNPTRIDMVALTDSVANDPRHAKSTPHEVHDDCQKGAEVKLTKDSGSQYLMTAILGLFLANLPAQAQVPSTMDDSKLVESVDRISLPVVELEQLYVPPTGQRYRVEIYATGRANYQGLVAVKSLGQVDFDVSQEKIAKIVKEFESLGFWDMKEKQYGTAGFGHLNLRFTLRWMGKVKTVAFVNLSNEVQLVLKDIIEREVRTEQWRCPFVDVQRTSRELCAFEATREQRNLELYLKQHGRNQK